MNNALHPNRKVDRLYLPRKDGRRGLLGVEHTVPIATASLQKYVKRTTKRLLSSLSALEDDEINELEVDMKKQKKDGKES